MLFILSAVAHLIIKLRHFVFIVLIIKRSLVAEVTYCAFIRLIPSASFSFFSLTQLLGQVQETNVPDAISVVGYKHLSANSIRLL